MKKVKPTWFKDQTNTVRIGSALFTFSLNTVFYRYSYIPKKTSACKMLQVPKSLSLSLFCERVRVVCGHYTTLLLMSPILYFERCLDSNPESCRSKQATCQLSQPSPYLATISLTQPPVATHLPTQLPISLLSHPSPCVATHLPSQPPISLLSHPSPYLAIHFPAEPPIFSKIVSGHLCKVNCT